MADQVETSVNADSMTNAQGEFAPKVPRSEPLQTSGHQPGRLVGNDAAPEFNVKVLPAGSAPPSKTFQPNPVDETPGQANNPDAAATATSAQDTIGGATSGDVHMGLGHPGSGQTSNEIKNEGKHNNARERQGLQGLAEGGSGMQGEESAHAKNLQKDHVPGPQTGREHNVSLDGAESKESVDAEQVASMGDKSRKQDYDRTAETAPGSHS